MLVTLITFQISTMSEVFKKPFKRFPWNMLTWRTELERIGAAEKKLANLAASWGLLIM